MARVKCAICSKEANVSSMKRCNNCEIWLCPSCAEYPIFGPPRCPKCKKPLK
jgi:hypothetical protein